MNFYKRFIGDIQAKTGNLSLAEFGAYDRLLDHYFSTESALPPDVKECYRICRAMDADERKAVDKVLRRFFVLQEHGWVQSKADEVIADAIPKIEAARANGKKGGRPKKETEPKPNGFPNDNPTETQDEPNGKTSQSQSQSIGIHGVVAKDQHGMDALNSRASPSPGEVCRVMKSAGLQSVNPQSADLIAAIAEGVTLAEFDIAAQESARNQKPFAYAIATARGRRKDAANPRPGKAEPLWAQQQRARIQAAVPGIAERTTHPQTIDVETRNVTPLTLG